MGQLRSMTIPVTPIQQNCLVIWDTASGQGTVIDPGGDVPRILDALAKQAVKVEQILLTHGHFDHAGGAAELKEALSTADAPVPVVGPDERDRFLLDGLEDAAARFGIPGARNLVPDRWLVEGDQVTIAGVPFQVLHCPGHTPGHLAYVAPELNFAIVGDVLFRGSVGRTDFPYGDHDALITSIMTKLLPLGDQIAFACGHGIGSTFGQERQTNPFLPR